MLQVYRPRASSDVAIFRGRGIHLVFTEPRQGSRNECLVQTSCLPSWYPAITWHCSIEPGLRNEFTFFFSGLLSSWWRLIYDRVFFFPGSRDCTYEAGVMMKRKRLCYQ